MPRYQEFPDAEAVTSVALRAAGLAVAQRVYSGIPKVPTYPLLVVQRLGGVPAERHHLDRARIQVDAWANSKDEAHDAAAEARVALHELEGTSVTSPDAYITAVVDSLGLSWAPDPITDRDRYLFAVEIFLH